MLITRQSQLTGKTHTMEIDVTPEQMQIMELPPQLRPHIQDIFPNLEAPLREFIFSGITPEEWDDAFGDDEEIEMG